MVDPRTLREVKRVAACHLIPDCFKVSSLTVDGDGDFDSEIGTKCDEELRKYIQLCVGDELTGKTALVGGSNKLSSIFHPSKEAVSIPKPKRGTVEDWANRALGLKDGKVNFGGFVGDTVDGAGAWLSIVNSALLVLSYQGRDISSPDFDLPRQLLNKIVAGTLTTADDQLLIERVLLGAAFDMKKAHGQELNRNAWRQIYDPSFDPGDGVFDDFPNKSVSEQDDCLIVKLPYSKSLRGTVKFALSRRCE